jgi:uncharacterized DUF497 family protein
MGMQFEWDLPKDLSNQRKHGVGFREATTVFGDPFATTFPDAEHSTDEQISNHRRVRDRLAASRGSHRTQRDDPDHQRKTGNSTRKKIL